MESKMHNIVFISKFSLLALTFFILSQSNCLAQESSPYPGIYIYGNVVTSDNETFSGYIRWGKEEMYWHDIFNSIKTKNFKPTTTQEKMDWKDIDWSLSSIWTDTYQNNSHTFACEFGDLSKIIMKRGERAELEFRNGAILEVLGGSNDIGSDIIMHDHELGRINFDWEDIIRVEFYEAPHDITPPYGRPLYGTVTSERQKTYSGHIKWDLDERNGDDILDGDSKHGSQKVPFEKIKQIDKHRSGEGVHVTFDSGRSLFLDGSNDCDDGNRGIGVFMDGIGTIELSWEDFESVTFEETPLTKIAYNDYSLPSAIYADVTTYRGEKHSGYIAYDKDEIWSFEFIDGKDDDIEYKVPVRNINLIQPKNRSFSLVQFKSGEQLFLGDTQDVSRSNDGILIYPDSASDPLYISWDDIEEILFK